MLISLTLLHRSAASGAHRAAAMELLVTMAESLLGSTALGLRSDPAFWQLMRESLVRTPPELSSTLG